MKNSSVSVSVVKASNFGPHGNFGFLFLQVPYLLWMNHVLKMNRTEFVDLKLFYNFYSFHFSVGRISTIASSPSEKEVRSFHEVIETLTVCCISPQKEIKSASQPASLPLKARWALFSSCGFSIFSVSLFNPARSNGIHSVPIKVSPQSRMFFSHWSAA